ncbi:MAG TPA: tetratricopeptide repeat protein [Polyangia bacterium]|nr:tetratricopeptide repeat protein [Polyangia bacterium]
MIRLVAVVVLALVTALSPPSRAQERDTVARARLYFETGRLLFDQGDYEQAAKKFSAGYDLVPRPQFLLNMGLCYQKLEQLDKARALYQRFLSAAPADDPDRAHATQWMAEVDAKIAATRPAPTPEPAPEPAPATAPPATPSPPAVTTAQNPGANLTVTTTAPPQKKSFIRRNWWIFPVAGVVVAGAAVGIYFAARPSNPCSGVTPCLDLR